MRVRHINVLILFNRNLNITTADPTPGIKEPALADLIEFNAILIAYSNLIEFQLK